MFRSSDTSQPAMMRSLCQMSSVQATLIVPLIPYAHCPSGTQSATSLRRSDAPIRRETHLHTDKAESTDVDGAYPNRSVWKLRSAALHFGADGELDHTNSIRNLVPLSQLG